METGCDYVNYIVCKLVIGHTTRTKALLNRYSHKVMKIYNVHVQGLIK